MKQRSEFKVGLFIVIMTVLIAAAIGYVAYKKGVFTKIRDYHLSSQSGEDLTVGMPVVFSGFTIGKVSDLELSESGIVLITIKVPERHVKWLKADSRFIINKPLLGAPRIVVSTRDLKSPPLPSDAVPEVVTVTDINEMMNRITPILDRVNHISANIEALTTNIADPEGDVIRILKDAKKITGRFSQKESLLAMAVGDQESERAIHETLRKTRDIAVRVEGVLKTAESMATKTEDGMYGQDGILPLVSKILKDLLGKLQKLDKTIDNINKMSSDAADSTTNLKLLRSEVDLTITAVNKLIGEVDRMLPQKKEIEIKLP